jgi:hypothetical protein
MKGHFSWRLCHISNLLVSITTALASLTPYGDAIGDYSLAEASAQAGGERSWGGLHMENHENEGPLHSEKLLLFRSLLTVRTGCEEAWQWENCQVDIQSLFQKK